jgi:DNA-binding response OmpR family regulator
MKLLLVEDEPDLGAAIARALKQEKYVVDWVADGLEAWNYLDDRSTTYKLGIFDWLLPGLSGLELCKRLRAKGNSLPILMLTAKDRMEDKVAGLDAGADDYLVKPFGMAELLARLRALERRSPQFQPQQMTLGNLTLDYATYSVYFENALGDRQTIKLTAKEFQLLKYFMQHPNQIVSSEQIRDRLWEMSAEPVSNVVAAHMRLLRRKLAPLDNDLLIETIHGIGYCFRPNHEPK